MCGQIYFSNNSPWKPASADFAEQMDLISGTDLTFSVPLDDICTHVACILGYRETIQSYFQETCALPFGILEEGKYF